jgi:N-acyl-D-amino-acid deacylase
MSEMLIRGGLVLDGTGSRPRSADVRIVDGRIAEIAPGLGAGAASRVIDVAGAYVAPGFIDLHTHLDPSLFWDPRSDPMPQHGITSAVIGNCSLSLAPLRPAQRPSLVAAFSHIEDIPEEAFRAAVPWTWETFGEYLEVIDGTTSLNICALVGHSSLRLFAMGDAAWDRLASADEVALMVGVLEESLDAGAIGLSSSLFDEDATGRPVPSRRADDAELQALIDVLHRHRGMFEFVPNLAGDYDGDLRRIGRLSANKDVVVTWTGGTGHTPWKPDLHRHRLGVVDECRRAGADMRPQISPRSIDVRINWDRSMAFQTLANSWQRVIVADRDGKRALLTDPAWRASARKEWDSVSMSIFPVSAPERVRLIGAVRAEDQEWVGRTFAELVERRGGHPSDVLADWVLANDLAPAIVAVGVSNDDPDAVVEILSHPATVVGSSDAGAHCGMLCAYGDTTLLLTRFVRERGDFTVEAAVHELTGRPAELLGWTDRGTLVPGAVADITVFDLDKLAWHPDVFVDDMPAGGSRLRRPSGGYLLTMVAGVVTQEGGELTADRPGRVIGGTRAGAR